jgi:hypothetical protein
MPRLAAALAALTFLVAAPVGLPAQADRFHAIGCISRRPDARYVITDTRADPPIVSQLLYDEKELEFHVGHTVEVSGVLSAGGVMKVETLVWISNTCRANG